MNRLWRSSAALRAIFVCLVLGGCSGFDLLNLTTPRASYTIQPDIAYGDDPRQKLDVLMPSSLGPRPSESGAKLPVVVFIYGGSWRTGSRGDYRFAGEALASQGFVTAVIDYRLFPKVKFPAFQTDAALALRWVHDHIAEYAGDPDAIFVMGHSAGAHMAALLAVDPSHGRSAGVPDGVIKGVIGLAGPYAMVPSRVPAVSDVFAGLADENVARPVHFAAGSAGAPPMLLLYGLDDRTVGRANAVDLTATLRAAGGDVTLVEYPGVGHAGLVLALAGPFRGRAPVIADTAAFIGRIAGPCAGASPRHPGQPGSAPIRCIQ